MTLYGIVKVLHILAMAALIAGMSGRALLRARLVRGDDIRLMGELIHIEGQFDEWLVVRAGLFLATIPLVIWVYVPRGKRFGAAFQAALAQQRVTVELRAALTDRAIRLSYLYEYLMVAAVTTLMVTKPF
jgi:hypothetical protein